MSPVDSPADMHELTNWLRSRPASDLPARHAKLLPGHPSSGSYPPAVGGRTPEFRHLTDSEYADHVAHVEDRLTDPWVVGMASHVRHTIDDARAVWSDQRDVMHLAIIEDLYDRATEVPCEGAAILAGGLPGAGKTTILAVDAGDDLSQYFVINPDLIKTELAGRHLIPLIKGLSPMEASDLVHEETSYLAKRLAAKAQADGRNVIWDVTMSRTETAIGRIESLRTAGYARIDGVFVDVPIAVSAERAGARHRKGHDDYLAGYGSGDRYISPATILNHADSAWGSGNRRNFEQLKPQFDGWRAYDNSSEGVAPALVASGGTARHHPERQHR
jgi:predicted kinase